MTQVTIPTWQERIDCSPSQDPLGPVEKAMQAEIDDLRAAIQSAPAQPELMVDMTPPATSRDRWMYEQGRLAERDPRSHPAAQPVNQVLVDALRDAATSLETISRLAGRTHYVGDDGERVETYMGHHDEVRGYAASRAGVARTALAQAQGLTKREAMTLMVDAAMVEMANIVPPLNRSDCERLIRAATGRA